jgi:hypothetical protein
MEISTSASSLSLKTCLRKRSLGGGLLMEIIAPHLPGVAGFQGCPGA